MNRLLNIKSTYNRVKGLYLQYERILMPLPLVSGFLVDYFTFVNINIRITFTVLIIYWLISGLIIIFMNVYASAKLPLFLKYIQLFSPLIIQFTFGALLGSSLIFYWFFGAFSVSWPLMLAVALLAVFNDVFRTYFTKPVIQISVYYFITFSLFTLILPFLFNSLSTWIFIASGILSIIIFAVIMVFLYIRPNDINKKPIFISVLVICAAMNILYFTDMMPPIPLALREAGIYHSIDRTNGLYVMKGEQGNVLKNLLFGETVHVKSDEKVYLYTAVFAPAKITTDIFHHWKYYDQDKKRWISKGALSFSMNGGRKEGYKGYSFESNLMSGRWLVSVENQRGQVLGVVRFTVKAAEGNINLIETVR